MLEKLNRRLKEDNVRVRIEDRGKSLYLRASLPDRQTGQTRQQRICLNTTDADEADRLARHLGQLLSSPAGLWTAWDARSTEPASITFGEFRAAGRKLYDSKYSTETAWTKKWRPALNKLPPDSVPCSDTLIVAVVQRMKEGSAGRRDQGNVLSQIAYSLTMDGAAIQVAARGYTASKVEKRDIPTDTEIEQLYGQIKLPHWRWMYGMLACYGLRPHEIIEAKVTADGNCEIGDETKTGFHIAWPCHERWLQEFNLRRVSRPRQSVASVAKAANDTLHERGPLTFPLYNLRHAYAIRLFHKGVPSDIGARLMGHSEEVHRTTYKRWYDAREITQLRERFSL